MKAFINDSRKKLHFSIKEMSNKTKLLLLTVLFCGIATSAQATDFKGVGRVTYKGSLDAKERLLAEQEGIKIALKNWVSQVHPSHINNFIKIQDSLFENIDQYVLSHVVIDSDKDKSTRQYTVVVRANLNEPLILNALIGASSDFADGEGELISFVFVAREVIGQRSKTQESTSQRKFEEKSVGKNINEDKASKSKGQTRVAELISEKTTFKDQVLWDVSTANEIDAAMGNVFTNANYLTVDAAILEEATGYQLRRDNFIHDYKVGKDLTPKTIRDAVNGLRDLEDPIRYFAIGTLDIDEEIQSNVTGLVNVPVSVTGQVLDIKRSGAVVAKVGPIQMEGEGKTFFTAKNNALKLAGEKAAQVIVAQLSSKNIR